MPRRQTLWEQVGTFAAGAVLCLGGYGGNGTQYVRLY